jgi:hypothetical protein
MTITFNTFCMSRDAIDDAREISGIGDYYEDETQPVPIFHYLGGFYIERLASGFGLPLGNTYQTFTALADAEAALWEYAEAELQGA